MAEGSLHFEFVHFGEDFDLYFRALAPPALVLHRADCHVCVCSGFVSEQSGRTSSFLSQSKRVNLMTPTPPISVTVHLSFPSGTGIMIVLTQRGLWRLSKLLYMTDLLPNPQWTLSFDRCKLDLALVSVSSKLDPSSFLGLEEINVEIAAI